MAAIANITEVMPEFLKNLNVGDTITFGKSSGYMGDGGCAGQDDGYAITRKIISKWGKRRFHTEPQYPGNEPEVFTVNRIGDWLNHKYYSVYDVNGNSEPKKITEAAIARLTAVENAAAEKKEAKKVADWTKRTKGELLDIINAHLAKSGKRCKGFSTAKKQQFIDFIKTHNIPV